MKIFTIAPWKLSSFYEQQVAEFALRISKTHKLFQIFPIKKLKNLQEEESFVCSELQKIPQALVVCLDENGKQVNSESFADMCFSRVETSEIVFVFGGAYGQSKKISEMRPHLVSLSPLTFPHELSYLVLLEQLYRASCIHKKHPYHHAGLSPLAQALRK
jgi:rRNA large subunit m3Psi methyltransferase RlmH